MAYSMTRVCALVVLSGVLLVATNTNVRADGGATAVAAYLSAEAQNFAAQAAGGWKVSYGPVIDPNGKFEMTFKNEIRYGPGGIGKETWWVDVKGDLRTGTFDATARGSDLVEWVNWYKDAVKSRINDWRKRWNDDKPGDDSADTPTPNPSGHRPPVPVPDDPNSGRPKPPPKRDPRDYRITLRTGQVRWAGTDADVYITLIGSKGDSGAVILDNPGNDRERGDVDSYSFQCRDVGEIGTIIVWHDNSGIGPAWFLDSVDVESLSENAKWMFECKRWLALDEDDRQIRRELSPTSVVK